jgi:hypothetical protein
MGQTKCHMRIVFILCIINLMQPQILLLQAGDTA